MIMYVVGDATHPMGEGKKFIVHVCNDRGGWGAGFVLALSKRWKEPEQCYRSLHRYGEDDFRLGRIQYVSVGDDTVVINMIAQKGYGKSNSALHRAANERDSEIPLQLDHLEHCLQQAGDLARREGASVHMPRIGCGLAGGKWKDVEPIVERTLEGIDVFVYDVP